MTDPNSKADTQAPSIHTPGNGLTKRELFALEAMKAVETANSSGSNFDEPLISSEVASRAVRIADELIEELNKVK